MTMAEAERRPGLPLRFSKDLALARPGKADRKRSARIGRHLIFDFIKALYIVVFMVFTFVFS